MIDTDRDGYIGMHEMKAYGMREGRFFTDLDAREIVGLGDTSGRGRLSPADFRRLVITYPAVALELGLPILNDVA